MDSMNVIGNKWLSLLLQAVILLCLQVFLFSNLHFDGWCLPFVYISVLICMPVMPRWAEVLVGALIGWTMDICCSSAGMHTIACTCLSWLRPMLLERMVQDADRITGDVTHRSIGLSAFVRLTLILCLLHHGMVFMLDAWSIMQIGYTTLRWLLSSAISILFVYAYSTLRAS